MAEKKIKTRVQQKHDIEANWITAGNNGFVPMAGEIIVYDIDSTYTYERFKIGDGTTTVSNLPFVVNPTKVNVVKSISAGSGSLTGNTTASGGIKYVEAVTHTAASASGTAKAGSETHTHTYSKASLTGSNSSHTTKYMKFSAGSTPITATVENGVLILASGTAPSMNFNTGATADTPYVASATNSSLALSHTSTASGSPSATTTFVTGVSGGGVTPTTKYLHHTHTASSATQEEVVKAVN